MGDFHGDFDLYDAGVLGDGVAGVAGLAVPVCWVHRFAKTILCLAVSVDREVALVALLTFIVFRVLAVRVLWHSYRTVSHLKDVAWVAR